MAFRIYLRQHWAFLFLRFYTVIFVSQEPHQGFWALFQVPWTRETKNLILSFCQCCVFDTWCKPAILMFLKVLNRFLIRGAEVARLSVISVRLLWNSGLPFGRVGWAIVLGAPFAAWYSLGKCVPVCCCLWKVLADSLYSTAFKLEVCYGLMNENRKVPLFCINCFPCSAQ